ncbi:MAG: AbrB/MazE/SpoVT family DNA-binding domain-containing protein [Deltaproteobacteria bacterium]|nr:AbrB/MazE/SpoVT family DNA-binding domain-containing protein [Deltaproteobacteria bacterium]
MKAIISEKGQVTIPQKLREQLGLKPGEVLEFEAKGGTLVARKSVSPDRLDSVVGILRSSVEDTDSYLDQIRGSRKK